MFNIKNQTIYLQEVSMWCNFSSVFQHLQEAITWLSLLRRLYHNFKGITHGRFYIYINLGTIMHWANKWHKEHEDLMVCVPGLVGTFQLDYIKSNFKLFTYPYTC